MVKYSDKIEEIVLLPEGISAEVSEQSVKLKSGKGELVHSFKLPNVRFTKADNLIIITGTPVARKTRSLVKTIKAHLKNLIKGLQNGHQYKLAIVYSHFPLNVQVKGTRIEINNFLGEKQPRIAKAVGKAKIEIKGREIFISGIDITEVSQTAANIEQATKIKGKDRRVFQDGIFLVNKGSEKIKL